MKYISTILSVIALGLIAILFLTQSRHFDQLQRHMEEEKKSIGSGFKIAYFDMDSLEAHYDGFKDAQQQVKEQESRMTQELTSLDRKNQKTIESWRQKGNTMTPAEQAQAQQEYAQMQQEYQSHKQALEQDFYKMTEDKKTELRKKIEDYLKDYNKQKNYSYIIQFDANSFIYTKDTVYNITADLVDGLNAAYRKK
ncbi:MAG TPA: OmpH family outer membrane protein [Puia sp.]|nr:OmpH family outer membrane protein [Puia sp.]